MNSVSWLRPGHGIRSRAPWPVSLMVLLCFAWCFRPMAAELLPPGFRPLPLGSHALVGGKVVVKPGESLDNATVIIRDGLIRECSQNATVPPDARVWDMKGTTIYAGFIEPYLVLSDTNAPVSTGDVQPVTDAAFTSPGVKFFGVPGAQTDLGKPGPGYEVARITPDYRVVRDYSPREKGLASLRELGFGAALVVPGRGIIRGTSALVALADADPNSVVIKPDVRQHLAFETTRGEERVYPSSLMGVIAVVRQSFLDAEHYALDHADYARHPERRERPPFDPALEALGPVRTRKLPVAFEPGSALMVHRAARLASELNLDLCMVSCGQEWRRPDLAKATGATFIVPLNFPSLPKLPRMEDWDQVTLDALRAWDWAPENPALLRRQNLEIALTTYGIEAKASFRKNLQLALDRGLSETDALAALTTVPARLCGVENLLGTIAPGKLANLTVVQGGSYFDPQNPVREVWIDGRIYRVPGREPKDEKPETRTDPTEKAGKKSQGKDDARTQRKQRLARSPLDDRGPLAEPKSILVRNATLWTCGPQGTLEHADLLIAGDKIKAVGKGLSARSDYPGPPLMIDGAGLHVTPGLIDCHSHTAILGAVNESSLPSTAMVRIHDVVNSETENLYQQLAGGVTVANLLHGSANPIGGQNCVIKLRDGAAPEDLVFADAPAGIKFALGENVKQANWGEKFVTRFPQTRMGVRTFIANRFTAAQQYLAAFRSVSNNAPPTRRDLELEALGEILEGKRWIHCHAYRQDEILMLIRLMESFHVQIGTFQHVLEGYKVADEIARHGAGASSFADWWAYKFEVYDAIPYNGSLMRDRGVLVSFNSDSSELARRLYAEAAKAVKYGGTPEIEALKFVTINPAKQLRIDQHVGSLEPGKDADFVLWSKSPLDSTTICLQTWIEGRKYFDREANAQRVARREKERNDLLARAKTLARSGEERADAKTGPDENSFFRVSLEHEFDYRSRSCLDEQDE